MKVLVVADSAYGNTWSLAGAIGDVFGRDARLIRPAHVEPADTRGLDLLIVGSPTQGGRPLPSMANFLKRMATPDVRNLRYAAFDTRIDVHERNFALKLLVRVVGYAAPKLARELSGRGAYQVVPPEGFIVVDREGPLADGELDRAREWAQRVWNLAGQ